MPVPLPPCVPVALVCVAPAYLGAVGYDYALRMGAPPPRLIDDSAADRLGVRISLFTGDLVVPVAQDDAHTVCLNERCVIVGSLNETPTSLWINWGDVSPGSGEASVFNSLDITASDPSAKAAAIRAVFLPAGKAGGLLPLSVVVEKKRSK